MLATDKPVMVAPAMNHRMWDHQATCDNVALLRARGVDFVGPEEGAMACDEWGVGRMAEPETILGAVEAAIGGGPLAGLKALVTSGPTHEPIDPVRYIANRSSGKQGHAIAAALCRLGADTTLISCPTSQPVPAGVRLVGVQSARDMLAASQGALPVNIAVCAAAVADWRVAEAGSAKIKKNGAGVPDLALVENPDILFELSRPGNQRPGLVIGFAAETENVVENAKAKLARKGCDWIVANNVGPESDTFGGDQNTVHLISQAECQDWPTLSKDQVAERLARRIADSISAGGGS